MDIDANLLRWANLTAIQRLARSLGVDITWTNAETQRAYRKRLIEATAAAIGADKRRAAAEEQRMKDEEARREAAAKIADALGETGERPRAQIARIVALMGAEWTRDVLQEALKVDNTPILPINWRSDGQRRTIGGVFFAVARTRTSGLVACGAITRRDFFRCFTDRPAKPRQAPVKPAPKGKERVSQLDAGRNCFRARDKRAKAPQVEVYAVRRRP